MTVSEQLGDAERYRALFTSNPVAFEFLLNILTVLKWRGTLDTAEDIARHNAAEEIIAYLGGDESGFGWSSYQVATQLRACLVESPTKEGEKETDVRRS